MGIGNTLLSDEGAGVRAIERLRQRFSLPPAVEVVDGGTAGMGLIDLLAGRRHLIVVDAIRSGSPAGTLVRLADGAVPVFLRQRMSPHQLGLPELLAFLQLMDAAPQTVTILGVEPKNLDQGTTLSLEVEAVLDSLVALIVDDLVRLGIVLGHPA